MLSFCGEYALFNGVWYHVHYADIYRNIATELYLNGETIDS